MFIGGLNSSTTSESLRTYFSQYGDVASTTVMKDTSNGRSVSVFLWMPYIIYRFDFQFLSYFVKL